jgi:hypothetical protein
MATGEITSPVLFNMATGETIRKVTEGQERGLRKITVHADDIVHGN